MHALLPGRLQHLLVLGAHCDDAAIGAGGTLLTLCRANPGLRVTALVLVGAGTGREAGGADGARRVLPQGRTRGHGA